MQPIGVLGELEPIATIVPAITAIASNPIPTRTMRRSRDVVSRRGVFCRFQWS
jgi:hypothetical protein